jgi:hypothetical protein
MNQDKKLGTVYEFCSEQGCCPIAIESEVSGQKGLEIKDDFGSSIKLTDGNLRDLKKFLEKRLS